MDTWAQSNMRDWNGWNVQIEVRAGHCALTLWRRDSSGGTVVWCWGSRAVMACSDHGGSLDVEERSGKLRRSGVTTRRRLVLSDPRARRSSPPRSTKLPRVVDGYVQPFENGRLRSDIHPGRRVSGRCSNGWLPSVGGNYTFRCFYGHSNSNPCFGPRPHLPVGALVYCAQAGSTRPVEVRLTRPADTL
jgi:hypothetical protein